MLQEDNPGDARLEQVLGALLRTTGAKSLKCIPRPPYAAAVNQFRNPRIRSGQGSYLDVAARTRAGERDR